MNQSPLQQSGAIFNNGEFYCQPPVKPLKKNSNFYPENPQLNNLFFFCFPFPSFQFLLLSHNKTQITSLSQQNSYQKKLQQFFLVGNSIEQQNLFCQFCDTRPRTQVALPGVKHNSQKTKTRSVPTVFFFPFYYLLLWLFSARSFY